MRAGVIALLAIAALVAMVPVGSAGASERLSQSPARELCDDVYESPPAKIARPIQIILDDKAAQEANVGVSDADLDEYLDAHFSAEAKIKRWLTKHCLVCTTSETAEPRATAVLQICPIGVNGQLLDTFEVEKTRKHGSCGQSSARVASGLRCSAGKFIYDPCWSEIGASRSAVVCMSSPWETSVTRLLTNSQETVQRSAFEYPAWGVELESGVRCTLFGSGAHSSVSPEGLAGPESDVIDYYCEGSDLVLLRGFDESGPLWRARGYDGRRLPDQGIVTAWFS